MIGMRTRYKTIQMIKVVRKPTLCLFFWNEDWLENIE